MIWVFGHLHIILPPQRPLFTATNSLLLQNSFQLHMIALAPRSSRPDILWFQEAPWGKHILKSPACQAQKAYTVEEAGRVTETMLLLLSHGIVKSSSEWQHGLILLSLWSCKSVNKSFFQELVKFFLPKIFLSSVLVALYQGYLMLKKKKRPSRCPPPPPAGAQLSAPICIVFYTLVFFRS